MWIGKDYDERTRWLHTYSGDPNDLMEYTTDDSEQGYCR
jgi:hypothetical protein